MPAAVPVKATSAWAAATSPRCVPPSNATRRGNSTAAQARLQPATSIPRKLSRWVRRPGPNVRTLAAPPRQPDGPREDAAAVPYWIAAAVTAVVLLVLRFAGDALEDADTWGGIAGLDAGDLVGSGLWALSLWYCSPAQLLLLFLGKIETERPSDWVMWRLGVAAGLDVDAIDYEAPVAVRALTLAGVAAAGLGVSWAFSASLGDATWAISTGIGACIAAAVYEVGRPERLSVDEAQGLEAQWQDFAAFADANLARSGRCHETEVFRAFRQRCPRYRSEQVLSDARLRDMVRNWHGGSERSRTGWYKNVSVRSAAELAAAVAAAGAGAVAELPTRAIAGEG